MSEEHRPYQPSNGTEGEGFLARFCYTCQHDRAFRESDGDEPGCGIIVRSMIWHAGDPDYPVEWTYDAEGKPTCTAYVPEGEPTPVDEYLEAAGQLNLLDGAP
jgi:hypothetical protein